MIRTAVLMRLGLVALVALLGLVDACTFVGGHEAVAMAPVLAPYRTPLYLAVLLGTLLVLAGVRVASCLAALAQRGNAFSDEGLGLLRRLRVLLGTMAGYLLVCAVGMDVVLERWQLGMPGVWLAALVGEVALLSALALVTHLIGARDALVRGGTRDRQREGAAGP